MFDALRQRLTEVQQNEDRLLDAAISVATELRLKVRARKAAGARRRRQLREALGAAGLSPAEIRGRLRRGRRRSSGVSIEARSTGTGVTLTASDQVQHFRRTLGETPDIMAAFAKHFRVAEKWRARRGL